jgi:hypothetical protein
MRKPKIRIEKVTLQELKKILPETLLNGNGNPKANKNNTKENKRPVAKTSKPKSKS